jgi:hypothetical protein
MFRSLLLAASIGMLARPAAAQTNCSNNSYFPLSASPATTRTYKSPTGTMRTLQVTAVAPPKVTMTVTDPSNATAPIATAMVTCLASGLQFDFAQAISGTASVKVTSSYGATIPMPDTFKVWGTLGAGITTWMHGITIQATNGPVTVTMSTTETKTIVAKGPISVPAHTSGWTAFKVQVDAVTTVTGYTGLPNGVTIPIPAPTKSTTYEWVVENVGIVQHGPSTGPYTQLWNCTATPGAPAGQGC